MVRSRGGSAILDQRLFSEVDDTKCLGPPVPSPKVHTGFGRDRNVGSLHVVHRPLEDTGAGGVRDTVEYPVLGRYVPRAGLTTTRWCGSRTARSGLNLMAVAPGAVTPQPRAAPCRDMP